MPRWLAPLATMCLPGLMAGAAAALFMLVESPPLGLIAGLLLLYPTGLAAGYVLVGAPRRGLAVTAGGYAVLGAAVAFLLVVPTAFEDAGVLVALCAGAAALAFVGFAAWAAWDVTRLQRG